MPITHSDPASDSKLLSETKIIPLSVDWPAFPSAFSLGSESVFTENDFHIHVPSGGTPKDGPSAGVGMVTSIISAITEIPVNKHVAITGEIT